MTFLFSAGEPIADRGRDQKRSDHVRECQRRAVTATFVSAPLLAAWTRKNDPSDISSRRGVRCPLAIRRTPRTTFCRNARCTQCTTQGPEREGATHGSVMQALAWQRQPRAHCCSLMYVAFQATFPSRRVWVGTTAVDSAFVFSLPSIRQGGYQKERGTSTRLVPFL